MECLICLLSGINHLSGWTTDFSTNDIFQKYSVVSTSVSWNFTYRLQSLEQSLTIKQLINQSILEPAQDLCTVHPPRFTSYAITVFTFLYSNLEFKNIRMWKTHGAAVHCRNLKEKVKNSQLKTKRTSESIQWQIWKNEVKVQGHVRLA